MTAYLYRAPAGIPGSITRTDLSAVEPGYLDSTGTPTAFGVPVKIVAGKFQLMGLTSVAADFYGVLARIAPSISGTNQDEVLGTATPWAKQMQSILTRGYINVTCLQGTPARNGGVYVRVVDGGVGKPVGAFEAVADGVNSVLLTGVIWATTGKDSSNNAELRVAR